MHCGHQYRRRRAHLPGGLDEQCAVHRWCVCVFFLPLDMHKRYKNMPGRCSHKSLLKESHLCGDWYG